MKSYQKENTFSQIAPNIEAILNNAHYQPIIESNAFQRLKDISFLGAIDYAYSSSHFKKAEKSRYFHSLSVAALAALISRQRNYSQDIERHVVAAALLHDIGHLPLSHSIEPLVKSKWGLGHHELGISIASGDSKFGKDIYNFLSKNFDFEVILALLDGTSSEEFRDLFFSPINIDTIDGILRSASYLKSKLSLPLAVDVAMASFIEDFPDRRVYLDKFWKLKDVIYREFILSDVGIKADIISQHYFESHVNGFDQADILSDEKQLKRKHPQLFKQLNSSAYSWVNCFSDNITKDIVARKYLVDRDACTLEKRYVCKKTKSTHTIFYNNNTNSQLKLFFENGVLDADACFEQLSSNH